MAGRPKAIMGICKRITKELGANGIYGDSTPEQALSQYAQFKRADHEQQLEAIKKMLAGFIFEPNVIVRGTEERGDKVRVIELSYFDRMTKATRLYLETMNLQNKMWGLYGPPEAPASNASRTDGKVIAAEMVHELQRIAKKGNLALTDSGTRATDKGTRDPELRGTDSG